MQQRVSLCRALALRPTILLMDEPFAALDEITREVMQEELLQLWSATESTVIFITHSISEAVLLSERVIVMTARPGRVDEIIDIPFARPARRGTARSARVCRTCAAHPQQASQAKCTGRGGSMIRNSLTRTFGQIGVFVVFFALWELAVDLLHVKAVILPPPSVIFQLDVQALVLSAAEFLADADRGCRRLCDRRRPGLHHRDRNCLFALGQRNDLSVSDRGAGDSEGGAGAAVHHLVRIWAGAQSW